MEFGPVTYFGRKRRKFYTSELFFQLEYGQTNKKP